MERSLLKRQQLWSGGITPRPLRKDENTLSQLLHFSRRAIERFHRRLTIRTINEYRPRKGHKPAQKRPGFQRLFSSDGTIRRENGSQHQHIELSLMIRNENRGSGRKVLLPLDYIEMHTRSKPHDPFETPCGGPLRYSSVTHQSQNYGRNDAVGSAYKQRGVGG